jgi:tetratricopeptide (TPR) repeat protein/KaiC/GvpD/RAD55 family RecA-like ATPase
VRETPLIDRVEEMGVLKEAAERAIRGEGGLVFLYGEAGIGKTRLARELRAHARSRGMQILYGRCPALFRMDGVPPYVLWKEVIRDYLQVCTPEQLQSAVGYYPGEIYKIVPEIKQKLADFSESPPLSPELERDRLFEAVSQFVENISKTVPLVVVLDDLQWADPSSLLLLHYLARGVYRDSLVILGAYRDIEVEEKHPLFPVLTDLKRTQLLQSAKLKRLSLDEVSEMIKRILWQDDVPREFCKLVYEKTRGNPFFVEEVMQSLKEEGIVYPYGVEYRFKAVSEIEFPETVRSVLQARIGRLDDETQQALTMASFIGNDFTLEALQRVTGFEESKLLEIIERMMEKKLLKCRVVRGEDTCGFSDVLVRDVLYESVGPLKRKKLHGVVGFALEKAYAKDIDEHLGELAAHFLESGDKQKALDYFLKAGEKAAQVYANREAASYYQSALGLLKEKEGNVQERARVLEVLGDIQGLVGEFDASLKSLDEALLLRQQLGEKGNAARLCRKIAHVWVMKGDSAKAKEYFGKAQEILEALPESVELASLYVGIADMFWRSMEWSKGTALVEKALGIAKKLNAHETIAAAYMGLGSLTKDRKKATEYYEEALKVALDNHNMGAATSAYGLLGSLGMGDEDREKCLEYARKGHELTKKVGAVSGQAFIGFNLAGIYAGMGDMDAALLLTEESVALNRKSGNLHFLELSLIGLGQFYTALGEWDRSEKLLNEGLAIAQKMNNMQATSYASLAIGYLLLEKGEYSRAKEFVERVFYLCEKAGAKFWEARYLALLIQLNLELGELEKAEVQVNSLQQLAQELKDPEVTGPAMNRRAWLLRAQKKYDESIALFEMILQGAETRDLRRWNARFFAKLVLFEYARVYLERNQEGDKQKALNLLNQALEIFRKIGAKKDIEKTEAILLNIEKGIPVTLEPKPAGLVATGYAVLDKLLYGGIRQNFAVALTSPSCDERDSLIKSFLETGAREGEPSFYLATDPSLAGFLAEEFPSNFYLFVCNPQAEAIVKNAPNVFSLKGVESLTNINIALTQAIRKLDPAPKTPRRICIGLLSDLLLQHGPLQTRKWLTELLTQLRSAGFTTLAVIDSLMHSPEQLHAVLGLFDGEVNIREAETEKGLAKFLKVKRMSSQKYLKDEMLLTEE